MRHWRGRSALALVRVLKPFTSFALFAHRLPWICTRDFKALESSSCVAVGSPIPEALGRSQDGGFLELASRIKWAVHACASAIICLSPCSSDVSSDERKWRLYLGSVADHYTTPTWLTVGQCGDGASLSYVTLRSRFIVTCFFGHF